ncbi:MAG: MarR family winged helix-turn-helix transcriptional regulator [Bacteroidales bacterium]
MSKGFPDVTPDYWIVIEWLWEDDNITIGTLAKRTNKDNAALTRILNGMERNNLANRVASASDKRSFQIVLTDYAKSIFDELKNIEQTVLEKSTGGLNPIEVKELVRMLDHQFEKLS